MIHYFKQSVIDDRIVKLNEYDGVYTNLTTGQSIPYKDYDISDWYKAIDDDELYVEFLGKYDTLDNPVEVLYG